MGLLNEGADAYQGPLTPEKQLASVEVSSINNTMNHSLGTNQYRGIQDLSPNKNFKVLDLI